MMSRTSGESSQQNIHVEPHALRLRRRPQRWQALPIGRHTVDREREPLTAELQIRDKRIFSTGCAGEFELYMALRWLLIGS